MDRPKRRAIPKRTKRLVGDRQDGICLCGCGTPVWDESGRALVQFDHDPALKLRDVNEAGTDYIPPQHDPDYIVARCVPSHRLKTSGAGATTAGTDIGKIKKERRRLKPKMKRHFRSRDGKIQNRGFDKRFTRRMDGRVVPRKQKARQ